MPPKNETQPETAQPSPGVDAQVDPQKIKDRAAILVQHGTDPLLAEKIAEDAERAQIVRDQAAKKLQAERANAKKKGGK